MIQVMAPCTIPFPENTVIYGSMGNTMLPDPMLGSSAPMQQRVLLNKVIGDDMLITSTPPIILHKAYDLLGDILYEYTLFQIEIAGTDEPHYIPISVKRYNHSVPYTFLFTRGITLALDILRGTRDYTIMSATTLMKMFDGNAINFVDDMFTIEYPSLIDKILSEIGSYAFYSIEMSDLALRYVFEELSESYDELIAYSHPTDIISYYGCRDDNYVSQSALNRCTDFSSSNFYKGFAEEIQCSLLTRSRNMGILKLDNKDIMFFQLNIQDVLSEIYQAPYTDLSMTVDQSGSKNIRTQLLFGKSMPSWDKSPTSKSPPDISIATYLHDGLIRYNQRNKDQIESIIMTKDWLDNFYLDVYMRSGELRCYYLNMALYHLYSPSIVRKHISPN